MLLWSNIFKNPKFSKCVICHSVWAVAHQGPELGLCLPKTRWWLCKFGRLRPPLLALDGLSWGEPWGWGERRALQSSFCSGSCSVPDGRAESEANVSVFGCAARGAVRWMCSFLFYCLVHWPHLKTELLVSRVSALAQTLETVTSETPP